jgi:hypothetical protein
MKRHASKLTVATLLAACIASGVGCYYPPPNQPAAYNQDSKGYDVSQEPLPQQAAPRYAGVDPGLAIAGAAAAGVLGYAIGNNHGYNHHHYYGPRYYGPRYYGPRYYGPRYYRPVPYGRYYGPRYYR